MGCVSCCGQALLLRLVSWNCNVEASLQTNNVSFRHHYLMLSCAQSGPSCICSVMLMFLKPYEAIYTVMLDGDTFLGSHAQMTLGSTYIILIQYMNI